MSSFLTEITIHQVAAIILQIALLLSMFWIFRRFKSRFGHPPGYLLAFIAYWLFWYLLMPVFLLGGINEVLNLFRPFPGFLSLSLETHLALWWSVLFPLFFMFIPRVRKANLSILAASIILGIIIGVTEEVLWRGVYMCLFPAKIWLNLVYPHLMFGLWHLAPQSVVANRLPGGTFSFVAYAVALGVTYAINVNQTGSIPWATVSHILHDTLGLGDLPTRYGLRIKTKIFSLLRPSPQLI